MLLSIVFYEGDEHVQSRIGLPVTLLALAFNCWSLPAYAQSDNYKVQVTPYGFLTGVNVLLTFVLIGFITWPLCWLAMMILSPIIAAKSCAGR